MKRKILSYKDACIGINGASSYYSSFDWESFPEEGDEESMDEGYSSTDDENQNDEGGRKVKASPQSGGEREDKATENQVHNGAPVRTTETVQHGRGNLPENQVNEVFGTWMIAQRKPRRNAANKQVKQGVVGKRGDEDITEKFSHGTRFEILRNDGGTENQCSTDSVIKESEPIIGKVPPKQATKDNGPKVPLVVVSPSSAGPRRKMKTPDDSPNEARQRGMRTDQQHDRDGRLHHIGGNTSTSHAPQPESNSFNCRDGGGPLVVGAVCVNGVGMIDKPASSSHVALGRPPDQKGDGHVDRGSDEHMQCDGSTSLARETKIASFKC
ncbi:hypothetical protein SESBI_18268 [Sesbania bispinosa]|nr:hypothetical protein SESBI_18268 [Sesbania bispinosa]